MVAQTPRQMVVLMPMVVIVVRVSYVPCPRVKIIVNVCPGIHTAETFLRNDLLN